MSTGAPLVSVVMPVYNAERYIDQAILSIRNQTLRDLELIIVNDGSRDRSLELALGHAALDPRVRVIDQPNAGIAAARNRGIAAARAPYLALMDNDDVSLPERLQRQYEFLQAHPEVAALGTHGVRIGEDGRELGVFAAGPATQAEFERRRARNEVIYLLGPSAMMRTEVVRALGGFRDYVGGTDDVDLWTRISDRHAVLTLTAPLYLYRIHQKSTSTQRFFRDKLDTLAVETNTLRRRAGQAEYSPAEFERVFGALPLWTRANHWRVWRSLYFYRVAGGYLANRQARGTGYLFGSMLLAPEQIFTRLHRQLAPWFTPKVKYAALSFAASWAWVAESFEKFLERW